MVELIKYSKALRISLDSALPREHTFNDYELDPKYGQIGVYRVISFKAGTNQVARNVLSFDNYIPERTIQMQRLCCL